MFEDIGDTPSKEKDDLFNPCQRKRPVKGKHRKNKTKSSVACCKVSQRTGKPFSSDAAGLGVLRDFRSYYKERCMS